MSGRLSDQDEKSMSAYDDKLNKDADRLRAGQDWQTAKVAISDQSRLSSDDDGESEDDGKYCLRCKQCSM